MSAPAGYLILYYLIGECAHDPVVVARSLTCRLHPRYPGQQKSDSAYATYML